MADWINRFLDANCSWLFPVDWEAAPGYVIAALIHCFLLINVVAVGALFFIWLERKVSARIQDRLGPTRVGGKFGWLQTLADGLKLITKEDLVPKDADRFLFKIAPYVSFAASYAAFLALPFSDGWVGRHINVAVFFILAVMGLEVFGVILAGYASGSKWSLFGAMRQAAQVVSYEVPMGLCVVVPVLICGSMDLQVIANFQQGWFTNWLVFHDPFTFIICFIYFTCALASVNRAPFDLAEAESELVAGFHTEYSGLRWSVFFMAEYGSMFVVSGLAAILFFGGWHGPIPLFDIIGWSYSAGQQWHLTGYLANLFGCANFIFKVVIGVTVMIWIRWTLPRLRIDQVMTTCLKYCVPIAAVCFAGVVIWQALEIPFINDLPGLANDKSTIRESWVLQQAEIGEDPEAPPEEESNEQQAETADSRLKPAQDNHNQPKQTLANHNRRNSGDNSLAVVQFQTEKGDPP